MTCPRSQNTLAAGPTHPPRSGVFPSPAHFPFCPEATPKARGKSAEVQGPPRSSTAPSAGLSAGEPVRRGGGSQPGAEAVLRVPPPRSGPLRSPREAFCSPSQERDSAGRQAAKAGCDPHHLPSAPRTQTSVPNLAAHPARSPGTGLRPRGRASAVTAGPQDAPAQTHGGPEAVREPAEGRPARSGQVSAPELVFWVVTGCRGDSARPQARTPWVSAGPPPSRGPGCVLCPACCPGTPRAGREQGCDTPHCPLPSGGSVGVLVRATRGRLHAMKHERSE